MQLRASDEEGGLHPKHEGQLGQGGLLIVCGHMRHQRQILDQPTALPLRRVSRAQHAPLTRLQSSRPTHLHHIWNASGGAVVNVCHIGYDDSIKELHLLQMLVRICGVSWYRQHPRHACCSDCGKSMPRSKVALGLLQMHHTCVDAMSTCQHTHI